jgi:hypothetical protein
MIGNKGRFVAIEQGLEPSKVRLVERLRPPNRHTHAMEPKRIIVADLAERGMGRCTRFGWCTRFHVVFGMYLEESVAPGFG